MAGHGTKNAQAQLDMSSFNLEPGAFVPGEFIVGYKEGMSPADIQGEIDRRTARASTTMGKIQNIREDIIMRLQGEERPEDTLAEIQTVNQKVGVQATKEVETFQDVYLYTINPNADPASVLQDYANLEQVAYVEPNYIYYATVVPNDTQYDQLWGMKKIKAEEAWDISTGKDTVLVGVVDSGASVGHPDLTPNLKKSVSVVAGCQTDVDQAGHGTHVSGTIGAVGNNTQGVTGVNWTVSINAYCVLPQGSGTIEGIATGVNRAVSDGVKVINMSLGGSPGQTLRSAIQNAKNSGVTVVVAAGNCGTTPSRSGCGGDPGRTISADQLYPANDPNVITVGSTTESDALSSFSSIGQSVDISAPGSGIQSTKPGGTYGLSSGTSMATPHVAGAAAFILSINPNLTPDEVQRALQCTADDLGAPGWDPQFGHGRLNVKAAADAVKSGTIPTCSSPNSPTAGPQPTSGGTTPTGGTQPTGPQPTSSQGAPHPCPTEAQRGNYNCDSAVDNNDYKGWEADFKIGSASLAPWFEYIRKIIYNRS